MAVSWLELAHQATRLVKSVYPPDRKAYLCQREQFYDRNNFEWTQGCGDALSVLTGCLIEK